MFPARGRGRTRPRRKTATWFFLPSALDEAALPPLQAPPAPTPRPRRGTAAPRGRPAECLPPRAIQPASTRPPARPPRSGKSAASPKSLPSGKRRSRRFFPPPPDPRPASRANVPGTPARGRANRAARRADGSGTTSRRQAARPCGPSPRNRGSGRRAPHPRRRTSRGPARPASARTARGTRRTRGSPMRGTNRAARRQTGWRPGCRRSSRSRAASRC